MALRISGFVLIAALTLMHRLLAFAQVASPTEAVYARSSQMNTKAPGSASTVSQSLPGTLQKFPSFRSRYVKPREVDVWLPPGYEEDPALRYPVLYMQDGQNLFDPATSYNGTTWGVAETISSLAAAGTIRPAIVVGIWNTPKREAEYMPQKAAALATKDDYAKAGIPAPNKLRKILSDEYLKFLVYELKPFIDGKYRTLPGQSDTMPMGSSMGGLISLYAVEQYPSVFGAAACLSTHWPALNGVSVMYFKSHLPSLADHRLYFDFGTETLDAQYEPYQKEMDGALRSAGYIEGKNWITRKFEGAKHEEGAWRQRLDVPLVFLLGK